MSFFDRMKQKLSSQGGTASVAAPKKTEGGLLSQIKAPVVKGFQKLRG
jgi:hypothetical protein